MSSYEIIWSIILLPFSYVYSVLEFKRGIKILIYKEDSYNIAVRVRLNLIEIINGPTAREKYLAKLEKDEGYMRSRGISSLISGIIGFIINPIWTWLVIISIFK